MTHMTFNAGRTIWRGKKPMWANQDSFAGNIAACTWGHLDAWEHWQTDCAVKLLAGESSLPSRPSCPQCAVLLDALLEARR